MEKYKIIALFGKSGAGKDTIQKWLVSNLPNANRIISCTTRPMREHEKDGVDYFFLSEKEFSLKVINGTMLEATNFNGWFYGTPIQALDKDKINIGVFNPYGIECILQDSRLDVLPLYIIANDKDRLMRSLSREENPDCKEICRRFLVDEKDFSDIEFEYDYFLNLPNKKFSTILEQTLIPEFINGQDLTTYLK